MLDLLNKATAFSHVAYAGAIVAFFFPAADKIANWKPTLFPLLLALAGVLALCWVAFLNMRWVQHCGAYLEQIERKINSHFRCDVLGWENYANKVAARTWLQIPEAPKAPVQTE